MITSKTVFILGAGASVPYGFPVGEALMKNIINNLDESMLIEPFFKLGFKKEAIDNFKTRLSSSRLKSIDSFLEHQSNDLKKLGKLTIAQELKKFTKYDKCDPEDDWYKEIWNAMYSSPELLASNQVSFITFNYDLSLEHYLYKAISASFELSEAEVRNIIRPIKIIHVHGKLGKEPWKENYNDNFDIVQVAEGIKIVSDNVSNSGEFVDSHFLIDNAERIYFVGFGYHRDNMRRLRINELSENKIIRGSSYGLTALHCEEIDRSINLTMSLNQRILSRNAIWKNLEFVRECVLLD